MANDTIGGGSLVEDTAEDSGGPFQPSEAIISNEALEIIENLFDVSLISLLALMGIVTNVIDIAVFKAQGFRDSVNISLTAIALWDLLKCVCGITIRVYGPLGWANPAYKETWKNLMTPTLVYLQVFANYVSYVLAAYVSFERCLCVSIPFKVKTIVTPKLTFVMMVLISVLVIVSFGIIYFIYDIEWIFDSRFNQTIAVFKYNDFYHSNGDVVIEYFNLIGIINPIFSFLVIVTCTAIIFYHLQKMSKFRSKSLYKTKTDNGTGGSEMSTRDRQVVKMLLVVIIVYIVALLPRFAHYIGKMLEPEFYYLKKYHNMFNLSAYTVLLFDYINASVNLFIYLSMSSNFRATFYELFPRCKRKSLED